MRPATGVAVVGAGPYGLSVAAHLSALGMEPRVFGRPMDTWRSFMPEGMVLKSEGFATSLSEPSGRFTLGAYCAEHGVPYQHLNWPVPLATFAAYGQAFQERFVPQLEQTDVARIERAEGGFQIHLENGELCFARQVVMATGIRPFARMPESLSGLPKSVATHSAEHGVMSRFKGRHVAVLGGGASAMDVAAALHRAGATATVVSRRSSVRFYSPSSFRSLRDRLLAPMTPLGPGWKKYLCVKLPDLFHALPERLRSSIVSRYLGPSPAWSVREIVENHVALKLNATIEAASATEGGVRLAIVQDGADPHSLTVDHVIAATGYRVDVRKLTMLDETLRDAIACVDRSPALSRRFESSVEGLYIVGTPAATSFGPMLRFVCGAAFTAKRVSHDIARKERERGTVEQHGFRDRSPIFGSSSREPVSVQRHGVTAPLSQTVRSV